MRATVRGRVQGVYFRQFVVEHACALGLVGYAKNLGDGASVEVVAEGERRSLDELARLLWIGPQGASVAGVDLCWGAYQGQHTDFRLTG